MQIIILESKTFSFRLKLLLMKSKQEEKELPHWHAEERCPR